MTEKWEMRGYKSSKKYHKILESSQWKSCENISNVIN